MTKPSERQLDQEGRMRRLFPIASWAFALIAVVSPAESQQTSQPKRVGLVLTSSTTSAPFLSAIRDGLRELGWVEGRDIVLEPRYHEGKPQRIGEVATELVRLPVDVIVTSGVPPTRAVKQVTQTIPIVVAAATDPVGTGLVTSGGNVAAFDVLPPDAAAKQLVVLRESVAGLKRVALVWNGSNPASQLNSRRAREAVEAAGLEVIPVEVPGPAELDTPLVAELPRRGSQAIFLVADPQFFGQRKRIGELTRASGLPTICQEVDYADTGCLIAYGANIIHMFRQSASYVDRILKGARPADLPIGPPTRFELVINLGTAKAIGLTIPQSVLVRADRRIE
jgi:putative ABC transport system substrate-binding protein